MSMQYGYNYAYIDVSTNMCIQVVSTTTECPTGIVESGNLCVEIPVNDGEYLCKYYIDGNWYEDAEGTIPWTSALL